MSPTIDLMRVNLSEPCINVQYMGSVCLSLCLSVCRYARMSYCEHTSANNHMLLVSWQKWFNEAEWSWIWSPAHWVTVSTGSCELDGHKVGDRASSISSVVAMIGTPYWQQRWQKCVHLLMPSLPSSLAWPVCSMHI